MNRWFQSLAVRIPVLGVTMLFICAVLAAYPTYIRTRRELEANMSKELLGIARSCAALVDSSAHENVFALSQSEFEGIVDFEAIRNTLRLIHRANQLEKPIYTLRPAVDYSETGEVEFVVMTNLVAGRPYVGNRMKASHYVRKVLETGEPICTPLYEDSEGTWVSAIAPILDEDEVVGVVSVDYAGRKLHAALLDMQRSFLLAMIVACTICGIALLLIAQPMVRRIRRLTVGTQRVASGDLQSRIDMYGDDELGRLAESFDTMTENILSARRATTQALEKAEKAALAKSSFLAMMTHEIRTPMTAILGFADLISDRDAISDEEYEEYVDIIQKNGQHLLAIISDVLDFSKIDAGKLKMAPENVNISGVVEDVADVLRGQAAMKDLDLSVIVPDSTLPTVFTDEVRVRQVVFNLIGNAIKFTKQGSVTIRLYRSEFKSLPAITIEVTDTGIGMTQEKIHRLFREFEQADHSISRDYGGTGLGLAISKRLVNLLGGDVSAESKTGQGSTFRVTLPLREPSISNKNPMRPFGESRHRSDKAIKLNTRVLVVDDGLANRRLLSVVLCKAGASVIEAENGRDAVDMALLAQSNDEPYDVILMDMQMPILDGFEATRELRERGYTRPIISLTANALPQDRQKSLEVGCDDFQPKPIDRGSLIAMVDHYTDVARDSSTSDLADTDNFRASPAR